MSNERNAKKTRQLYRRDMKSYVNDLTKEFRVDIIGNPPVNKKPKYMPKKLWAWMVGLVINYSFFEKWYDYSKKD